MTSSYDHGYDDAAAMEEEEDCPREPLSSNHYSADDQLEDAVSFLEHNLPTTYAALVAEFPAWETRTMGDSSSWFDAEAMGVDVEWSSWVIDWIEANSPVWWEDGEPWTRPGCANHGAWECTDPDCIRARGDSVLAAELRDAERLLEDYATEQEHAR